MKSLLLVGVGGFLGAIARFLVYQGVRTFYTQGFPIATLMVNVSGCFISGFLFEYWREHSSFSAIHLSVIIGFLGAFTTFSAFSYETMVLVKGAQAPIALANVGLNLVLCLAAVFLGNCLAVWMGR